MPFGKYVLLERISVGGMAEVFKAKTFGVEGFARVIAVKRILPSMAEDSDFITMFIDEANIAGQLAHANVCQIFELGKIDESHYIAMEFIWGKDLLQAQNRFRKLRQVMPSAMAAFIIGKMCEGIDYAHKKRGPGGVPLDIVHRDISPQNVLVSYEGEVKVIDFGIAKAATRSSRTQAGVLKGKFGYMSPEQVRGQPIDRRSDIFSIGTVFHELLTGERLFVAESDFSTLEKIRKAEIPPPTTVNQDIPVELERIVMRALTVSPDDRYQWASEMQADLLSYLAGVNPAFTAGRLSTWVKEAFGVEYTRERELNDSYRDVGPEVLEEQDDDDDDGEPLTLEPDAGGEAAPTDFASQATAITTSAYQDVVNDVRRAGLPAALSRGGRHDTAEAVEEGDASPFAAEKTQILSLDMIMPEELSAIGHNHGVAAFAQTLSAPIAVVDRRSGPVVVSPFAASSGPFPPADPGELAMPMLGARMGRPQPRHTDEVMPLRSSTAAESYAMPLVAAGGGWRARDVVLGAVVAIVLSVVVLGVMRLFPGASASSASGTLVVATVDGLSGDVLLDGKPVGAIGQNGRFDLRGVVGRDHVVTVQRLGSVDCREPVQVEPARPGIVLCRFRGLPTPGRLVLTVVPADSVVLVDERELSAEAIRTAILLTPGAAHSIRVARVGHLATQFSLTLAAGEEQRKTITLTSVPDAGVVAVAMVPAAAVVPAPVLVPPAPVMVAAIAPVKTTPVPVKVAAIAPPKPTPVPVKVATAPSKPTTAPVKVATAPSKPTTAPAKPTTAPAKPTTAPVKVATAPAKPTTAVAGAAAGEKGFLIANSKPWARLVIDGTDTGRMTPIAPRSKIPLSPGRHVVTFVVDTKKFSFTVEIEAGKDLRLFQELPVVAP